MCNLAMLGSGFISDFYTKTLLGNRSQDQVVTVYSRNENNARNFAQKYQI